MNTISLLRIDAILIEDIKSNQSIFIVHIIVGNFTKNIVTLY